MARNERNQRNLEEEFFYMASQFLDCRWHAENTNFERCYLMVGEMDYRSEMYLITRELKEKLIKEKNGVMD